MLRSSAQAPLLRVLCFLECYRLDARRELGLLHLRAWRCLVVLRFLIRLSLSKFFVQLSVARWKTGLDWSCTLTGLALFGAEVLSSAVASPSSLLPSVLPGRRQAWAGRLPLPAWRCLMLRSQVQVSLLRVLCFLRDYQPQARRFGSNRVLRTAREYAFLNTRWAAPKGRTEGRLTLKKRLPS